MVLQASSPQEFVTIALKLLKHGLHLINKGVLFLLRRRRSILYPKVTGDIRCLVIGQKVHVHA